MYVLNVYICCSLWYKDFRYSSNQAILFNFYTRQNLYIIIGKHVFPIKLKQYQFIKFSDFESLYKCIHYNIYKYLNFPFMFVRFSYAIIFYYFILLRQNAQCRSLKRRKIFQSIPSFIIYFMWETAITELNYRYKKIIPIYSVT